MKIQTKLIYMFLGALVGAVLLFGAVATFAQVTHNSDGLTTTLPIGSGRDGFGRPDHMGDNKEALAEALGISVEELETAQTAAREAAINQAVADGLITQEQADEMLANGGHNILGPGQMNNYLAEALGISVEELDAAINQVFADRLAEMVADGTITQEQADMIQARRSVQDYVDVEALQATMQAAYQDAVNQALADGVITQEQADALLSEATSGFSGFGLPRFGGPGGHHGSGGHPHGGPGGHHGPGGSSGGPENDDNTDTGNDA